MADWRAHAIRPTDRRKLSTPKMSTITRQIAFISGSYLGSAIFKCWARKNPFCFLCKRTSWNSPKKLPYIAAPQRALNQTENHDLFQIMGNYCANKAEIKIKITGNAPFYLIIGLQITDSMNQCFISQLQAFYILLAFLRFLWYDMKNLPFSSLRYKDIAIIPPTSAPLPTQKKCSLNPSTKVKPRWKETQQLKAMDAQRLARKRP